MDEIEPIDTYKDLFERRGDVFKTDREDGVKSRSMSGGFGFSEDDEKFRGKDRVSVSLNQVFPWVTSVTERVTANPFAIAISGAPQTAELFDKWLTPNVLIPAAVRLLKGVLNDGYSYVLPYNEKVNGVDVVKIKVLESDRVLFDECDDPTGEDARSVAYMTTMLKKRAAEKYEVDEKSMRSSSDPAEPYINLPTEKHVIVTTLYTKTESGVDISVFVSGIEIESKRRTIAGARRVPIVRVPGIAIWMPSTEQWHWRGAYWMVYDLLRSANYQMSAHTERIATAPLAKLTGDSRLISGIEDVWADMHRKVQTFAPFNGVDPITGQPLAPPILFPENRDNSDLLNGVSLIGAMVSEILGKPIADPPKDEREINAIMRKASGDASANEMIANLKDGIRQMAECVIDLFAALNLAPDTASARVGIEAGPVYAANRERKIMQLMAIDKMIKEDPANPALAIIIANLDLEDAEKNILMGRLANNSVQTQQAQAALAAKDQELASLNQQLMFMREALLGEKAKSEADIYIAQLNNASREKIEAMKQQGADERAIAQIIAEQEAHISKFRADYLKAENDRLKNVIQYVPNAGPVGGMMGVPRY